MVAIRFTIIFNAKMLLNFIACYDGIVAAILIGEIKLK